MYIGELEDPNFHWEGGDWNGNVPRSISGRFPHPSQHYNQQYLDWVNANSITYKQTDFGGWVARVKPSQIIDFLEYCYGEDRAYYQAILDLLETLDAEKEYALVATEY